jgi:hypothetical protein
MLTDTENTERGESSGSSQTRRRKNSDKSPPSLPKNSSPAQDAGDGDNPEPKLSSLNWLLSLLLSDLGEIRDKGGAVEFFTHPDALFIKLPNVAICQNHKMMHFGIACPMC